VVRYFGGVKLGVGGLISAYKAATEDALGNAVITEKEVTELVTIKYDYAATPEVMRLVKEFELGIKHQDFGDHCEMDVEIALRSKDMFMEKIKLLTAMGLAINLA